MNKLIVAAAALMFAGGAQAQGFSNGGVTLSYESFSWSGGSQQYSDIGVSGYAIFELGSTFDVQVGGGYMGIEYSPSNTYDDYNYNLHGIYNLSADLRIGAFYSNSTQWNGNVDDIQSYGLEAQYASGPYLFEAQAGSTTFYGDSATLITASATYDFGAYDIGGIIGWLSDSYYSTSMVAGRASYEFANLYNLEIYGQASYLSDPNYSSSETFLEVGISMPFGQGNKTPFYNPNEFLRAAYLFTD